MAGNADRVSIPGGCHCGRIRIAVDWPSAETAIALRECQCSFCRDHGAAWTSNREAALSASFHADDVSRYRFGTETATFHICRHCGVVPFVTSDIQGSTFAVVNVNTLDLPDGFSITCGKTDFDGESEADRLSRREKNWIPAVQLPG